LKTSSATEKKAHCEKPKADVKAFMATVIKPITHKASFLATVIHNFPFPYVKGHESRFFLCISLQYGFPE
jgi:hypothetical protein